MLAKYWRIVPFYTAYAREQVGSSLGVIVNQASILGASLARTPSCGTVVGEYPSRFFEWHYSDSTFGAAPVHAFVVRLANVTYDHATLAVRTGRYRKDTIFSREQDTLYRQIYDNVTQLDEASLYYPLFRDRTIGNDFRQTASASSQLPFGPNKNPDQIDKERLCFRTTTADNPGTTSFKPLFVPHRIYSLVFQLTTTDASSLGSASIELLPRCLLSEYQEHIVDIADSTGLVAEAQEITRSSVLMTGSNCLSYFNTLQGPSNVFTHYNLYRWTAPAAGQYLISAREQEQHVRASAGGMDLQAWTDLDGEGPLACQPLECRLTRQVELMSPSYAEHGRTSVTVTAAHAGDSFVFQVGEGFFFNPYGFDRRKDPNIPPFGGVTFDLHAEHLCPRNRGSSMRTVRHNYDDDTAPFLSFPDLVLGDSSDGEPAGDLQPAICGAADSPARFYVFTPLTSGLFVFELFNASFSGALAIWRNVTAVADPDICLTSSSAAGCAVSGQVLPSGLNLHPGASVDVDAQVAVELVAGHPIVVQVFGATGPSDSGTFSLAARHVCAAAVWPRTAIGVGITAGAITSESPLLSRPSCVGGVGAGSGAPELVPAAAFSFANPLTSNATYLVTVTGVAEFQPVVALYSSIQNGEDLAVLAPCSEIGCEHSSVFAASTVYHTHSMVMELTEGETVVLQVLGKPGAGPSSGNFSLSVAPYCPPSGVAATALGVVDGQGLGLTNLSMAEADSVVSPPPLCVQNSSLLSSIPTTRARYFTFTAGVTGPYVISTTSTLGDASSFDTVLAMYSAPSGDVGGCHPLRCNDDFNPLTTSTDGQVRMWLVAGTTVALQVAVNLKAHDLAALPPSPTFHLSISVFCRIEAVSETSDSIILYPITYIGSHLGQVYDQEFRRYEPYVQEHGMNGSVPSLAPSDSITYFYAWTAPTNDRYEVSVSLYIDIRLVRN